MIDKMTAMRNPLLSVVVALLLVTAVSSFGQTETTEVVEKGDVVKLRPDHPDRYVVQKGDTLWDIASRFLQSPWNWPKIWTINEQIANPHLIYPGDVLVLRFVGGRPQVTVGERPAQVAPEGAAPQGAPAPKGGAEAPVVREYEGVQGAPSGRVTKLSPRVIEKPLEKPIPTISPDEILPFLSKPLVVDKHELKKAGYVTIGLDDRIALGDNSEFYARGLKDTSAETYQLYRRGQRIRDGHKTLGYEAIYLGDARMLEPGDPSRLVVTKVKQEILPTDSLLIAPAREPLPYFFPHAPPEDVKGRIITAFESVSELGPFTIVTVNLGKDDGIDDGTVLRIMRNAGKRKDPVRRGKYRLPPEESGLMMVFRTFEQLSYGLVINATRPIHIHDDVITP
jgi:LysM repeat protein